MITVTRSKENSPVLQQTLKTFPSWRNAVSILGEHVFYALEFLNGNQNTSFFVMTREVAKKSRIFRTQTPLYTGCRNQLQKCIPATASYSLKPSTTSVLHGRSCNNFVALCPDVFRNIRLLRWEIFCDIIRQTLIWNTTALKQTLFDTASQSMNAHTSMKNSNTFIINEPDDSYRKSVTYEG